MWRYRGQERPAFAQVPGADQESVWDYWRPPALVDCFVDDEKVRPQPGGFYGGWVTDDIVGPFKGDPSTGHW